MIGYESSRQLGLLQEAGFTEAPPTNPVLTRRIAGRDVRLTLTIDAIQELERETGRGIGELMKRLAVMDFSTSDIIHVIRIALMAGGESKAVALAVSWHFVAARPADYVRMASDVLTAAFAGLDPEAAPDDAEDGASKKA